MVMQQIKFFSVSKLSYFEKIVLRAQPLIKNFYVLISLIANAQIRIQKWKTNHQLPDKSSYKNLQTRKIPNFKNSWSRMYKISHIPTLSWVSRKSPENPRERWSKWWSGSAQGTTQMSRLQNCFEVGPTWRDMHHHLGPNYCDRLLCILWAMEVHQSRLWPNLPWRILPKLKTVLQRSI